MNPRIIKTQADYESALSRIDALMESDPAPDTDAGAELELLVMLVEQYEAKHYPMEVPTPVEAIKFRMDQAGLKQVDLIPYIGSKSKVSEVLNGKRPLSLNMIRNLHKGLGIPAEVLVQAPNANDRAKPRQEESVDIGRLAQRTSAREDKHPKPRPKSIQQIQRERGLPKLPAELSKALMAQRIPTFSTSQCDES